MSTDSNPSLSGDFDSVPERRELAAVLAVLGLFIATGWWGILPFAFALRETARYNARLGSHQQDPSIWRTPRNRWQARTGIWPEMPDADR